MNEPENNFSRINRKKGPNRANTIMNILIAIVVVLIIITASMIFLGGNDKDKATEKKSPETKESIENSPEDNEEDVKVDSEDEENSLEEDELIEDPDVKESGVLINKTPVDDYVKETIIDMNWEPIGTKQSGEHVSLYDGTSDDWHEKIEAISYSTGLSKDNMIIWKIKNGGNSQKSVGIVSSKDEAEKYRVYLDWVDNEGWQPVKIDILATLDFDY